MTWFGEPAVPFALPDDTGRVHTLDDYLGEWLLLMLHRHLN
jgi:peroxiredoxin